MSRKNRLESTDSQSIEMLTRSSSHLIDDTPLTDVYPVRPESRQESTDEIAERPERVGDYDSVTQLANSWLSLITKRFTKWNHPGFVRNYSAIPDAGLSKVLPSSSRLLALRHFSWVHLPSIAITFTLLSLYIAEVHWENPSVEVLNSLQFAAKVHEGLILMSLSDILLSRISHGLNHRDTGIPLGFVSAAFYLGAPFRYLISSELWSPILHSDENPGYHGTTGAMIILVAILCVAASPLSAIAMIPRQTWWNNDDYGHELNNKTIVWTVDVEYYTHLNSKSGPYLNATTEDIRDAKSLGQLWAERLSRTPWAFSNRPFQNTTFSNYYSLWRPISITYVHYMDIATCPMSTVADSLGDALTYGADLKTPWIIKTEQAANGSTQSKRWKQPIVAVECMVGKINDSVTTFVPEDSSQEIISLSTKQYPALADLNDTLADLNERPGIPLSKPASHHYLGLRDTMNLPISTDILFVTTAYTDGDRVNVTPEICLCFVYARWIEAEIWIEPSQSDDVRSHLPFSKDEASSEIKGAFGSGDFIHIDQEWMEGIAATPNASFYDEGILGLCEGEDDLSCYGSSLALHIVDAIAEFGDSGMWVDDWNGGNNTGVVLLTVHFHTHTYAFQNSRVIPLAFSLFLLHVLMVLVHLVAILVSKHPWQGSTWDSVGDMLLLALRSKAPDQLDDVGERVTSYITWTKVAVVRDDGDDGQPQILVRENKEVKEPSQEEEENATV